MDAHITELVAAIVSRLTRRLGADGSRGHLLVLFTGATANFGAALGQIRRLVLDGYRIDTVFSPNARRLYGTAVDDHLLGFPEVTATNEAAWTTSQDRARAVVVPLLSLATTAKVAGLIADTLPVTILLRALAGGTPVVAVPDGARLANPFWSMGDPSRVPAALTAAADRHLATLRAYGCHLSSAARLRADVNRLLGSASSGTTAVPEGPAAAMRPAERVITAAHVRRAHCLGRDLVLAANSIVTPLARETAARRAVGLIVAEDRSYP